MSINVLINNKRIEASVPASLVHHTKILPIGATLLPHHLEELVKSGIDKDLIDLNWRSLVKRADIEKFLNLGSLTEWRRKANYGKILNDAAWVCGSQLKSDSPRTERRRNKKKVIKYENPVGGNSDPIYLEVPQKIILKTAEKFGVIYNGEEFWEWVKANPKIPVAVTEGVKKAGCIITNTLVPTIALPGHTTACYPDKGDLKFKNFLNPSRYIILVFDNDAENSASIAVDRTINNIRFKVNPDKHTQLAKLHVAQWHTNDKGIDDIFASSGAEGVSDVISKAVDINDWIPQTYNKLGYKPNVQFNSKRWEELEIPESEQFICLKGAKGTGKTKQIEWLVRDAKSEIVDNQGSKKPIIALTHRIELAKNLSVRLGIEHIDELTEKIDSTVQIALCVNSVLKITPHKFQGALVVIDEANQLANDFILGDLCSKNREKALKRFQDVLLSALDNGGRLVIADADLNYNTVNFFKGLCAGVEPFVIENTYNAPSYKCYLSDGFDTLTATGTRKTPADVLAAITALAKDKMRLLIHTTGRGEESKSGSINIEKLLLDSGVSSVIRIDSHSTKDPHHPAFRAGSRINQICDSYQVVIATPTIGTGVSIENVEKFDWVICIATGVGTPDAVRQSMMRLRDTSVNRILYAANSGLNNEFKNLGYTPLQVKNRTKDVVAYDVEILNNFDADWAEDYEEIQRNELATTYVENLIADNNVKNAKFREAIKVGLISENVEVIEIETVKCLFEEYKLNPQATYINLDALSLHGVDELRQKIAERELISEEELQQLKASSELTEEDQLNKHHAFIHHRYGGVDVTTELLQKDSEGWFDKIKLHYAATVGYEVQQSIHCLMANSQMKSSDGAPIETDFMNRQKVLAQVELLQQLGVMEFIESNPTISKLDEDSLELFQTINGNCTDINKICNIGLKPLPENIPFWLDYIKIILDLIGLEVVCIGRPRIDGKQVRQYQIQVPNDGRNEIYDRWLMRDVEFAANWQLRKQEYTVKKIVKTVDVGMSIKEFCELQNHTLFNDAWELVETKTRIQLINNAENYQLPQPTIEKIDPNNSNYRKILTEITTWQEFSIDTETFGNDAKNKEGLHAKRGHIRLIQISNGEKIYYADLGGRESNREVIKESLQDFLIILNDLVSNPNVKIIGQNVHFDLRFLSFQLGFNRARNIVDTMLGAKIFFGDYGELKVLPGGYGLGNLTAKFLGLEVDKTEQKSDWGSPLTQSQIDYAVKDPFITYWLYKRLLDVYDNPSKYGFGKLAQNGLMEAWQLENDIVPCAIEIETNGLPFDKQLAESMLETYKTIQNALLEEWTTLVPELTYTQNKKLKEHLTSKYALNIAKLDKTALADLAEYAEVKLLGKLRAIKIPIQQLESLLRSAETTGRVQTVFNTLTGTGRFSSGNSKVFKDLPNLQSISNKQNPALKELGERFKHLPNVIATEDKANPGKVEYELPKIRTCVKVTGNRGFGIVDLAASHARIAADLANDENAITGFNDDSIDNHSKVGVYVAKALGHDIKWEDIAKNKKKSPCKQYRDIAKNTFYAWLNGAGAKRVWEQMKGGTGEIVALEACQAAIKGCEALYPDVVGFRKQLIDGLSNRTNLLHIDGKHYAINKIKSVNNRITHAVKITDDGVDVPYTECLAAIWSRTEATALKRALIKIINLADEKPEWELKVINYVHDEINVEFNIDYKEEVLTAVNNIIGDCFAETLLRVNDGREKDWVKLQVNNWSEK